MRLNVAKSPTDTTPGTTTTTTTTTGTATGRPCDGNRAGCRGQGACGRLEELRGTKGWKVDVRYVPSGEAAGRIVAQSRPAGTELKQGDTVQLNVSEGANPQAGDKRSGRDGPHADGGAKAARRRRLRGAGAATSSGRDRAGHVLSQTPRGGASIPLGSLVILYVGD